MVSSISIVVGLVVYFARTYGQTFTKCDPTKKSCPDDPALGTSFNQTFGFDSSTDDYWTIDGGPTLTFSDDGALFEINQHGDAPTIQTNFYIFFGRTEVLMKAASGQGIVSSIVMLSDDLDEIDWEILGGNTTSVETNYYGKGDLTQMNAKYYPCNDPQASYHNYTTVWTSDQLEWHLDGKLVRTVTYAEAVKDGKTIYPQTPSFLKIGSWAAGDPGSPKGRIQWAGGRTNYDDGPFDMYIKSIKMTDGTNRAVSYSYGDRSGNYQSIDVKRGISEASAKIHAPPPLTLSQRWNNLSPTIRIVIIVVVAVVVGVLIIAYIWYCIYQRRLGKREHAAEIAAWDKEQAEMLEWKRRIHQQGYSKGNTFIGIVQR